MTAPVSFAYAELPFTRAELQQKALSWASRYSQVAYFDDRQVPYPGGGFRNLLGVSNATAAPVPAGLCFSQLEQLLKRQAERKQPLFGYLTYDLKNELERLHSHHPDPLQWPSLHFFEPQIWLEWLPDALQINSQTEAPEAILESILQTPLRLRKPVQVQGLQARVARPDYLQTVQAIREHIEEGDVYELNYCQEFFAENAALDPVSVFWHLTELSPMPFSGFYRLHHRYLLCASPERFLKQDGPRLLSQPIKGTARRGATPEEDRQRKEELLHSEKERAENMMIVDLVRNDFARVCQTGTVKVEELFGIYSFRFVHQMISTVSGLLRPGLGLTDALRATFPMGSMTGAPKISAMELIEQYEQHKRGLFSGSIGYLFPDGTADFNVIIRSLQYRTDTGYLSFSVGSAITFDSEPEQEYEECLLKAAALMRVLGKVD